MLIQSAFLISADQNHSKSDPQMKGGDPYGLHTRTVLSRQCHPKKAGMVQRKTHDKNTGGAIGSNRQDDGRGQTRRSLREMQGQQHL
jgi:hypothetical protein